MFGITAWEKAQRQEQSNKPKLSLAKGLRIANHLNQYVLRRQLQLALLALPANSSLFISK